MRNFVFILCLIFCSCETNDDIIVDIPCSEENCGILNPFSFSAYPAKESLLLTYGQYAIVDGSRKACPPDAIDFYISDDNEDFNIVDRVEAVAGNLTIEDLEDGKEYFIKMVNIHCELDQIIAPIQSVIAGEIPLPSLIDNSGQSFEDFRLSSDGDQFIYRSHSNDWYVSSLSNPQSGIKIIDDAFYAQWNPNSNSEISFVRQTRVNILPNLQGITSKSLMSIDIKTNIETVLHEIEHLHDFNHNEHNPEQYWIHEFHYALNRSDIYFISNKDNGSSSYHEKRVFDNLWKLDLNTGSIEAVSDFLPNEFEMHDFIEDPKRPGNFYLLGGTYGEKVEFDGALFNPDRVDIHYFEAADKSITPILISDFKEEYISIDPQGDNLIFTSDKTGRTEIWSYDLSNLKLKQITNSLTYAPAFKWHYVNWISNSEFMTSVRQDGDLKFATFNIE